LHLFIRNYEQLHEIRKKMRNLKAIRKLFVFILNWLTSVDIIEIDYYVTLEDLFPSILVAPFFSMCVYDPYMFKSN